MAGNKISEFAKEAARNEHKSLLSTTAIPKILLGGIATLFVLPDVLYVRKGVASIAASPDGTISSAGDAIAWLTAFSIMGALTYAIHLWFERLQNETSNKLYNWMAMAALVIVFVQPLMVLLEERNLAGSGFGQSASTAGETLGFTSTLIQLAALPICAIIASVGIGVFTQGWKEYTAANDAKQASKVQHAGVQALLVGERDAGSVKRELDEIESNMKLEFVEKLHDGAYAMANAYELYVEGKNPAPTRATFQKKLNEVFDASDTPPSSELAALVRHHMPEPLPIEALPNSGSNLPKAAQTEILAYARWIKANFKSSNLMDTI